MPAVRLPERIIYDGVWFKPFERLDKLPDNTSDLLTGIFFKDGKKPRLVELVRAPLRWGDISGAITAEAILEALGIRSYYMHLVPADFNIRFGKDGILLTEAPVTTQVNFDVLDIIQARRLENYRFELRSKEEPVYTDCLPSNCAATIRAFPNCFPMSFSHSNTYIPGERKIFKDPIYPMDPSFLRVIEMRIVPRNDRGDREGSETPRSPQPLMANTVRV